MMTKETAFSGAADWSEFQRRYWEAWSQLSRNAAGAMFASGDAARPWTEALESWWKTASAVAPPEVEDFYGKLIEQGKAFFRVCEGMTQAVETATAGGQSFIDWQQQLEQSMAGMKQAMSGSDTDAQNFMRQVMAFWELPLDTWHRTASSMSVLPGDFLQNLKPEGLEHLTRSFDDRIERFLSAPGVGYTREWQEQLQVHGRLLLEYQKAYQQYAAGFARFGLQCVERFEQKLKALANESKAIGTARELYDLWVDCCEDIYAGYVSTDEYAELHARLVNRLMALKRHSGAMIDEVLGAMNMPTRREVNTLHKRLQETRREGKAMRAELDALKEQIAQPQPVQTVAARTGADTRAPARAARTKKAKSVRAADHTSG